jgi:hypothetical protein
METTLQVLGSKQKFKEPNMKTLFLGGITFITIRQHYNHHQRCLVNIHLHIMQVQRMILSQNKKLSVTILCIEYIKEYCNKTLHKKTLKTTYLVKKLNTNLVLGNNE